MPSTFALLATLRVLAETSPLTKPPKVTLSAIKLPSNMKLISQNLPGSNYASDKPKEVLAPHPQRSSAMKAKDTSLPNIQEENEYDEIINAGYINFNKNVKKINFHPIFHPIKSLNIF